MPSLDRKIAAGDQFSFSSNSLPWAEADNDYGFAFGEWSGWHCDNDRISDRHNEPDWLAKMHTQSSLEGFPQAEAIARYKKQMLEMVKDMPEDAYELSLRDLVELPRIARAARESPARERLQKSRQKERVKKAARGHSRSGSVENGGFLLKMFFPMPSSGKKQSSNGLKPISRSSSSESSESGSHLSSNAATTPATGAKTTPNALMLMKDSKLLIANKTSGQKQHAALSRDCSR